MKFFSIYKLIHSHAPLIRFFYNAVISPYGKLPYFLILFSQEDLANVEHLERISLIIAVTPTSLRWGIPSLMSHDALYRKYRSAIGHCIDPMEQQTGNDPATSWLEIRHSTNWATAAHGGPERYRTFDYSVMSRVFYHWTTGPHKLSTFIITWLLFTLTDTSSQGLQLSLTRCIS